MMRRRTKLGGGALLIALVLSGCSKADTPTEPRPDADEGGPLFARHGEGFGNGPISLPAPSAGLKSEAWDINVGNRSAGVVFSAGQQIDGQAMIWEAPNVGGGRLLGRPPGFAAAVAYGITNLSRVAVTAYGPLSQAFLWDPAKGFLALALPAGTTESEAKDISNNNVLVGSFVRNGVRRAYRISKVGGFDNLHPGAPYTESGAEAVNESGRVAGWATLAGVKHLAAWSGAGVFSDLGTPGGNTTGRDLNKNGIIVGQMDLPAPFGLGIFYPPLAVAPNGFSDIRGISNKGRIVGIFLGITPATARPVVGAPVLLPLPPGATSGRANAVNKCGHSVGAVFAGASSQATFWPVAVCD